MGKISNNATKEDEIGSQTLGAKGFEAGDLLEVVFVFPNTTHTAPVPLNDAPALAPQPVGGLLSARLGRDPGFNGREQGFGGREQGFGGGNRFNKRSRDEGDQGESEFRGQRRREDSRNRPLGRERNDRNPNPVGGGRRF